MTGGGAANGFGSQVVDQYAKTSTTKDTKVHKGKPENKDLCGSLQNNNSYLNFEPIRLRGWTFWLYSIYEDDGIPFIHHGLGTGGSY
jgi:hypothetical protein